MNIRINVGRKIYFSFYMKGILQTSDLPVSESCAPPQPRVSKQRSAVPSDSATDYEGLNTSDNLMLCNCALSDEEVL